MRPSLSLAALAALASLIGGGPLEPPLRHAEEPGPEDPEERASYWAMQRTYPGLRVPKGAWSRAEALFRAPRRRPRDGGPIAWKPIGPAPLDTGKGLYGTPNMSPNAGRASAVAVDPADPKIVYAGYAIGGVWKSLDRGDTWAPLMDAAATLAVGAITLDPSTTPSTLYVGTGEPTPYIGYLGQGLLRSKDGGQTFEKLGGAIFDDLVVGRVLLDPESAALYVAAVFGAHGRGQNCNNDYDAPGQGVYRSTDGGATFELLLAGKIIDLEVDTSVKPRRILASDYATGVMVSADDGATWAPATGLPTAQDMPKARRIELAFSAKNPSIVYAGLGLGSKAALYLSTDGGQSFTAMPGAPDYCEAQCYYDNSIIVDPTDEKTVYLGGGLCGVWKSTNATDPSPTWANISLPNHDCKGGAAWATAYVHPDIHGFAFAPGAPSTLYIAGDGGIARTDDGGQTFIQRNEGVGTQQIYGLCADPGDAAALHGGAQDSGVFTRTATGFRAVMTADGGPCAVDPHNPKNVVASTQYATLIRSTTGLTTTPQFVFSADKGSCIPGAPGCGDRVTFIAPVVADPSTQGVFYVGTYRVWKTDDGGTASSWKAVSGDLTKGAQSINCPEAASFKGLDDGLTNLAVAPSDPAVLYAGSQAGFVHGTGDGGKTWARIDKAPLPGRWVSGLAVDPRDAKVVYASFSGFGENTPNTPGHVFRSADRGVTWELRDLDTDTPVNTLIHHPLAANLLYAGTDAGVLFTSDGGKSWAPLGDGLPRVPVYALVFHRAAGAIHAGTFGRSAWTLDLPKGAVEVMPAKIDAGIDLGNTPSPQKLAVTAADPRGGITHFTVTVKDTWASVDVTSGDAAGADPITITVSFTIAKLTPGGHDTTLVITPEGGAPINVPVHLDIYGPNAQNPEADKGCGCRLADRRPSGAGGVIALLAAAAIGARRRGRARPRNRA